VVSQAKQAGDNLLVVSRQARQALKLSGKPVLL